MEVTHQVSMRDALHLLTTLVPFSGVRKPQSSHSGLRENEPSQETLRV